MKPHFLLVLVALIFVTLSGCMKNPYPSMSGNLTQERWLREVDKTPNRWLGRATSWFLTGSSHAIEVADRHASYGSALSTMTVRVPNISSINVKGDFQVQIFGTAGKPSVNLYGPNKAVTNVVVEVKGRTLCLTQRTHKIPGMQRVIVRVGVNQLHQLVQLGCSRIEGIMLSSSWLRIYSRGGGDIFLSGPVNLQRVDNEGTGNITVINACTPCLHIRTTSSGCVNVSGNVGIASINHCGCNDINIIGANSDHLRIIAQGAGKIGINGIVNLQHVCARESARVYVCQTNSVRLSVLAFDHACVGIAGQAQNFCAETQGMAHFFGRHLNTGTTYVRAHDTSHMNVSALHRIYANASGGSTIFYFGPTQILTPITSGNGVIIPIVPVYQAIPMAVPVCSKGEVRHKSHPKRAKIYRGEG